MLESAPPLIIWAIPAFLGLVALEAWFDARDRVGAGYERKDTVASLSMGVGNVLVNVGWKLAAFGAYSVVFTWSPLDLGWAWPVWAVAFVADDFAYYWFHRLHHEVRLLWASHVPHHSSQYYNLSTALRQTWTPWTGLVFWLPLAALGFNPFMLVTVGAVNLLYQFWIHTERIDRLHPAFEYVFNTPSHHRVHHGSQDQYLDRNYGGILILFDRWFGTFEPEEEAVRYGLTSNIETYNPLHVAFHEYGAIWRDVRRPGLTPRQRVGMVLAGPGYAATLEPHVSSGLLTRS